VLARKPRPTNQKRTNAAAYGYTGSLKDVDYDHLVPLEVGGDPNDPRNLWIEPGASPNPKDGVESRLHELVCEGRVPLAVAQQAIATDWTTALDNVRWSSVIAASQGYETKASAEKGIDSVKTSAPNAKVVHLTEVKVTPVARGHTLRACATSPRCSIEYRLPSWRVWPCFNARMTSNQPWWLTWPVAEVAAAILPLFSYHASAVETRMMAGIVSWFSTGSYSLPGSYSAGIPPNQFERPDWRAVAEAMQVLEHAGLLMRGQGHADYLYVGLTRLGWHALQTNTVRQHLGLSDTPPTAWPDGLHLLIWDR
jgi:hypothetical protein